MLGAILIPMSARNAFSPPLEKDLGQGKLFAGVGAVVVHCAARAERKLEVPIAAWAWEKLPDKLHINKFKPAESVGGKTFPRSNLP